MRCFVACPALVFACLVPTSFVQAQPPEAPDRPLVTVAAVGEVETVPDEVVISIGVEFLADSVAKAREQTAARVNQILALAKQHGVADKDIQTDRVNIYPEYQYREPGQRQLLGYRSSQTIAIHLRDVSQYDPLLTDLLEIPIDRLDGITWKTSQLEELRERARRLAMQAAQAKARTLADAVGQQVGRAFNITEEAPIEIPPRPMLTRAAAVGQAGAEPTLAPGQITISTRVTVSFELRGQP